QQLPNRRGRLRGEVPGASTRLDGRAGNPDGHPRRRRTRCIAPATRSGRGCAPPLGEPHLRRGAHVYVPSDLRPAASRAAPHCGRDGSVVGAHVRQRGRSPDPSRIARRARIQLPGIGHHPRPRPLARPLVVCSLFVEWRCADRCLLAVRGTRPSPREPAPGAGSLSSLLVPRTRQRIWLLRLLTLTASVLMVGVALFLVEGILLVRDLVSPQGTTGATFEGSVYEFCSSRHHRLLPSGRFRHTRYEYDYTWAKNSPGTRDHGHAPQ